MFDDKKMKKIIATLEIGSTLCLMGCRSDEPYHVSIGSSVITYEANSLRGMIGYQDLTNLKIMTLKQNEELKDRLIVIQKYVDESFFEPDTNVIQYIDLETGVAIKEYHYTQNETPVMTIGEDIEIIKEQDISFYLFQLDHIQAQYNVKDIVKIYHDEIIPSIEVDSVKQEVLEKYVR